MMICMKLLPIKPKFIAKVRPRKQKEKVSGERKKFERYSIRQQQKWKLEYMKYWVESSGEIHRQQEKEKQARMYNNQ